MDNLKKISGQKEYKDAVQKTIELSKKFEPKGAEPSVIAKLVLKAITVKNPKTRYHGGFMVAPVLFLKKILPDKLFDKVITSQLR